MIPLHLKLTGFLSYRQPAEVDFTTFHLACISGSNGAGKSSLLDAITWVLFGKARKTDEALINLASKTAEVDFIFAYEDNLYRVLRSLTKGKTGMLEFQIADQAKAETYHSGQDLAWHPLTEHSTRETQESIQKVLRLDYDTFINVSFFLQGRADAFAQEKPARRKEILGNILGLETWEMYRERAAERRKGFEKEVDLLEMNLKDIAAELGQESERRKSLEALVTELERRTLERNTLQSTLGSIRQLHVAIDKDAENLGGKGAELERWKKEHAASRSRLENKEKDCSIYRETLSREAEIQHAYVAWQASRTELERLSEVGSRFHKEEKRREPFVEAINSEKARLEQEVVSLTTQKQAATDQAHDRTAMQKKLDALLKDLEKVEKEVADGDEAKAKRVTCLEQSAGLRVANDSLKTELDANQERIDRLAAAEGAACPLCGQALSAEHRRTTLAELKAEGKRKEKALQANNAELETLTVRLQEYEVQESRALRSEEERRRLSGEIGGLEGRLDVMKIQAQEWEKTGAKRLSEVEKLLAEDRFELPARKSLVKVDKELAALGYEASAHEAARLAEQQGRGAEKELRDLESARSALKPLEDEVANLRQQVEKQENEITTRDKEYAETETGIAARKAAAPDLRVAEQNLNSVVDEEKRLNQEVGGARQKVNVLEDQRKRQVKLTAEREEKARVVSRYQVLERAFGKDGIPALLIEQALPEIEAKANDLLDRLSDGSMSVRFVTQSAYKDRKRLDLKETLDIQISDGAGVRDYEMYSGGEAFRANFAIRLALSEVLASRKGARLQMLVIDEGFGSQDEQGRQRLIQAIRSVQDDFAKVLVITHLEELKDAFPARIEVEKGEMGSEIKVI